MTAKRLIGGLAAVGVAAVLILATPKAAHSLAAALVEVANTSSSPAIAQTVPTLASQIVTLVPSGNGEAGYVGFDAVPLSSIHDWSSWAESGSVPPGAAQYVVPAGRSLVITSMEVAEASREGTDAVTIANGVRNSGGMTIAPVGNWVETVWIPAALSPVSTQFRFSPGLVFTSGQNVWLTYGAAGSAPIFAELHGYLTAQ